MLPLLSRMGLNMTTPCTGEFTSRTIWVRNMDGVQVNVAVEYWRHTSRSPPHLYIFCSGMDFPNRELEVRSKM